MLLSKLHPEALLVVGRVASGKSTLCSAILNETILE
jgi:polynucleotide 5'-kinase involved in rRNA processing